MRPSIVALALAAGAPLMAQEPAPRTPRGPEIAVTGQGEARARPDRALVTVGVQSRAATATAAARDNAEKQRAILDTLRAMGFQNDQITTANYSVYPEMRHDERGQNPEVVAYVVSNTVQVNLRQLERAGQVIDAALAKGANQVHGLNFYLANPDSARRAAIADAVANARADAEALARAAGGSLGQVIEMSTSPIGMPQPMFRNRAMAAANMGADVATPVEPGQATVTAVVSVRWQFVPSR